jgi:hypothetical protein
MRKEKLISIALGYLVLWTVTATAAAPAHSEHSLKVGKKGEITLTQATKVGNLMLQPDTYVIQHRVSGGNHFVRFVELKQVEYTNTTEIPITYTEQDKAGELKCRLEPVATPIQDTTAFIVKEGGTPRITKVAIKGEDVIHVF